MREIITFQIGQCGNQIGSSFWKKLSNLHPKSPPNQFFYISDTNIPIPRAILLDLEPRVIQTISQDNSIFYNTENIFVSNEGGGAGNNWANGYLFAQNNKNQIFEMVQREAENSDFLEAFQILHSIGGGTGSGMGSSIIENLKDDFPKKIISSVAVFPNNEEISEVVVQPYNSILTLKRLSNFCDSIFVMDNNALGRISSENLRIKHPSYETINSLISTVLCASSVSLRNQTYMYSDLKSIFSTIIPIKNMNFILPSYSPFLESNFSRKSTISDLLRRLITNKSKMCNTETRFIISGLTFFINTCENVSDILDIQRNLIRIQDKQEINFVPWMPPSFHSCICKEPFMNNSLAGLSLINSTGIAILLRKICDQFDKLKSKNAFTEMYRKYLNGLEEFESARNVVENVIKEYENAELSSYSQNSE